MKLKDHQRIIELFRELDKQLAVCIKCGMCQSVCPVFGETRNEGDVARGKLALLSSIKDELFLNPGKIWKKLDKCLLCGSCASGCPRKVQVIEVFLKARKLLADFCGLDMKTRYILRKQLADPVKFNRTLRYAVRLQSLVTKNQNEISRTASLKTGPGFLKNRHFVKLAETPFHMSSDAERHAHKPEVKSDKIQVALFTGCMIDKLFPGIAASICKIAKHYNFDLVIPKQQGCCGIPAASAGDSDSYVKLTDQNLDLFNPDDFDYLITACATCTFTIKKIWPGLCESEDAKKRFEDLSSKTMDVSEFLVSRLGIRRVQEKSGEERVSVTYHDPCHLKRSLAVSEEPRELILASPGYELKEMEDSDVCCGMGGSFNLKHYDISDSIGNKKVRNIEKTGCRIVATGCPACMFQISDMLSKRGSDILVKHPVEIFADSLNSELLTP